MRSRRARGQPALTPPNGSPVRGWRSIAEGPGPVKRSRTASIRTGASYDDATRHASHAGHPARPARRRRRDDRRPAALALPPDDGTTDELDLPRARPPLAAAAWRLRALGLEPGDRLLTWSPSTPELPATYFGAMRAGLVLVPLDLRMSKEAVEGIVATSGARHLVLGTGRDAPDPREAGLDALPDDDRRGAAAEPDATSRPTGRPRSPPGPPPPRPTSSSWSSPRGRPARRRA